METSEQWATEEFGHSRLGDRRRSARLVAIARSVAERPAGTVTKAMRVPAEREGAFRFLEGQRVTVDDVARASHMASARRCAESAVVLVAVDQATLSIADHTGAKGFGPSGNGKSLHVRALEAMTALAINLEGMTLGVVAQEWWTRSDGPSRCTKGDRRPPEERESDLFRRALMCATDNLSRYAPGTEPWFQVDRGGDFWRVLEFAEQTGSLLTVRAAYDRRLVGDEAEYLSTVIEQCPPQGSYLLEVAARTEEGVRYAARDAIVELRFAPAHLRLKKTEHLCLHASVTVVDVVEVDAPASVDPLQWRLLTTYPVTCLEDAYLVVDAYTKRWRIEDFHRSWKSGACDVERSQLRSPHAFMLWATILAAVATRIERLKHLARNHPEEPAESELSRAEIDAAIILSRTKKWSVGATLTIADAVRLIADVGGYTGKSSGGPPGATVIARGLKEVTSAAIVIEHVRSG